MSFQPLQDHLDIVWKVLGISVRDHIWYLSLCWFM